MVGIVLLGVFVLLLALGAPIAVCLGMSSVSAILVQGAGKPLEAIMSVLPRLCSSASSKFVLLAIPFFILSGNVMEKAGISGRLINLAAKKQIILFSSIQTSRGKYSLSCRMN